MHEHFLSHMNTSKYDPGKPNEGSEKSDPNGCTSNLEAIGIDKKEHLPMLIARRCPSFGNVKHSKRNSSMILVRLWKRRNCNSHVSMAALKSKNAENYMSY